MTTLYIIFGILLAIGIIFYLKYRIPLRPNESGFEYVYVNEDGTVNELNEEDIKYLKTEFSPADSARPYIKGFYKQLTPDKKISGFISRKRVPKRIEIQPYNNHSELISWIFLAIAMASETEPADLKEISMIADGINHAVPTHKELQTAISWLMNKELINKVGKNYILTKKGKEDYTNAQLETKTLLKMWVYLEQRIKNYA